MSSRRLDISSLLCNDDNVPPHRPRPASTPTATQPPPPATPKPPYLGLEALVHVATEERRRLSGGSDSVPSRHDSPIEDSVHRIYSYPSTHQVRQTSPHQVYAPPVSSPVHTQSPTYSQYPQRPREHVSFHQPLPERISPVSPYTRLEEDPSRFQHTQRQKQFQDVTLLHDQRMQHHQHPVYSDTSILTLPPLRSPSMPLQVEDPEQLISRSSPLTARPRSGSVAHKYPLNPMQLDLPTPLSMARGSPRLSTPISQESPMSAVVPAPLSRESMPTYHTPPYHELTPNLHRRNSPSTLVREVHSPIMPGPSAPFVSHPLHRNSITEGFPPNKKRRHSDSPSRISTAVRSVEANGPANIHAQSPRLVHGESDRASQTGSSTIPPPIAAAPVPPPIAAAPGPTIISHRPDIGRQPPSQIDTQLKDRDSHKVVGALGRRSPPGSAIGRAKAARKVDEMERHFRDVSKRESSAPFLPKVTPTSSTSGTSDLKQKEERKPSTTAPMSADTKQEDAHEWFLQQFEKSPSHSSQQARRPVALIVNVSNPESEAPINSHASPSLLENQSRPPSPPRMSEEAVATLEQELEELLTEPDETLEDNKMDVDIDQAVTKLVADTLVNDQPEEEEEESPQPDKQDSYLTEADVDIELLRLVDDQPAATAIHDNECQREDAVEKITFPEPKAVVQPPVVDESGPTQAASMPHERGSMQPPAPPPSDAIFIKEENFTEATSVKKKTSKSTANSKKKDAGSKPAKSKVTSSTLKAKSKPAAKPKTKATEGTATPPLVPPKTNKLPIPPPVKKSVASTAASRSRSTSVMPSGSVGPECDSKNAENDEDIDASVDDDKLYCICKTKYDEDRIMIACDKCDEWYHTQCVNMSDLVVDLVDQFFCPICIERNPRSLLKTTYKRRCLNGLKHPNPESSNACHKPALGGGILSKFCSQDCGVKYMEARIDVWVKKGGKRESLWEGVKHAEKREGVVIRVNGAKDRAAECVIKTEDIRPSIVDHVEEAKVCIVAEKWQVKATKSHVELERLRDILHRVVKMREDIKKGMEVVLWREKLLELAAERAKSLCLCGWDQRLCFGDEEWAEFGVGVLESYESGGENMDEAGNSMQVDKLGGEEEGEWWCPGKAMCDRHAGWQSIRSKDISKEKEQKDEALIKLTTRERELRKRIEDIVDPHSQDAKGTPKKTSFKLSNANGRPNITYNGDPARKGKKRKSIMQ